MPQVANRPSARQLVDGLGQAFVTLVESGEMAKPAFHAPLPAMEQKCVASA